MGRLGGAFCTSPTGEERYYSCVNPCEDSAARMFNPCEDSVFVVMHASARYAADELDGSRARQTSGIEACEPVVRYGGARTVGRSSGQAATLKHPLSRKAPLWGGFRETGVDAL